MNSAIYKLTFTVFCTALVSANTYGADPSPKKILVLASGSCDDLRYLCKDIASLEFIDVDSTTFGEVAERIRRHFDATAVVNDITHGSLNQRLWAERLTHQGAAKISISHADRAGCSLGDARSINELAAVLMAIMPEQADEIVTRRQKLHDRALQQLIARPAQLARE